MMQNKEFKDGVYLECKSIQLMIMKNRRLHVIESWLLCYFSQDIPLVLEQRFYWPRMVYLTMRSHVKGWKTKLKYVSLSFSSAENTILKKGPSCKCCSMKYAANDIPFIWTSWVCSKEYHISLIYFCHHSPRNRSMPKSPTGITVRTNINISVHNKLKGCMSSSKAVGCPLKNICPRMMGCENTGKPVVVVS